jgi:hypothetical protein
VSAIVHTSADIHDLLRRGLTPITDNPDALVELGFVRAFPSHERDFESTIWERMVEPAERAHGGKKRLVRQRAFLYVDSRTRARARRTSAA